MNPLVIGLAVAIAVVVLVLVRIYNRLIALRNATENAFGTIDVQLKQRCDLIPKVVDAVRGAMSHEQSTLERLVSLREQAARPGATPAERVALDGEMSGLLRGLVARVEAYPDLKANETVLMLQRSLNEVEAQVAAARRTYNAAVTGYNTAIETVPANLVAGLGGFTRRAVFEASAAEREVPQVGALRP
jgi:LemA protein